MTSTATIFTLVDLLGVSIGAVTGALVARRMRFDITGHWTIALLSGLGGGIVRDVLLQDGPPLALTEPLYLPTVLAATLIAILFGPHIDQLRKTILWLDAFALASFAVAGCLRTFDVGLGTWSAVLLGVVTAVGGGVIREMMLGQTPTLFKRSELYGLAALGTCLVVVLLRGLGVPRELIVPIGIAAGAFLRLGSVRWGWMSWEPR